MNNMIKKAIPKAVAPRKPMPMKKVPVKSPSLGVTQKSMGGAISAAKKSNTLGIGFGG